MAIGPQVISIYNHLFDKIDSKKIKNVCEIGRQNLSFNSIVDDKMKALFKKFNKIPSNKLLSLAPKDNWGLRAKILYEELGLIYHSFDIDQDEEHEDTSTNTIIDLNFDKIDTSHYLKYDFVTNFGTSEHIFNQLNFFKTMHDITSVNGYMLSEVPCMFGIDHGMYKYEPKFFTDLARSNAYEIIDMYMIPDPPNDKIIKWNHKIELKEASDMCIFVIMKKTNDNKFCIPLCGNYELKIKKEILSKYKYNFNGNLISGDKTYYILREENNISYLKKEELLKELLKRFINKFNFKN